MPLAFKRHYPLSKLTWLGVGGPAEQYALVNHDKDLTDFLTHTRQPITILGAGSNVLIRDGGIVGTVLKLGTDFQKITVQSDGMECGAGVMLRQVAETACRHGWTGFEFLADIPGTLGGALAGNAGAFQQSICDVLSLVRGVRLDGQSFEICDFSDWTYRDCPVKNVIFTGAKLRPIGRDTAENIRSKMEQYHQYRWRSQPHGVRTAGSTFKNPKNMSAGFLIEKSGLKGYHQNGAEMSSVHANFLVNHSATGNQLEDFILWVENQVFEKQGIRLTREIQCLGER